MSPAGNEAETPRAAKRGRHPENPGEIGLPRDLNDLHRALARLEPSHVGRQLLKLQMSGPAPAHGSTSCLGIWP